VKEHDRKRSGGRARPFLWKVPIFAAFLFATIVVAWPEEKVSLASGYVEVPRFGIQAGFSLSYLGARDDSLVPLLHGGPRLAISPAFQVAIGAGSLRLEGNFGLAYLQDRYGDEGIAADWDASASYWLAPAGTGLSPGLSLGWDNDIVLFADWDDVHAYWIGYRWIGPSLAVKRGLGGGWNLELRGSLAVAGLASRPPAYQSSKQEATRRVSFYFETPNREPFFSWIGETQLVRASFEVYRPGASTSANSWTLGGELRFARASLPLPAYSLEASLRAAYSWRWR